MCKKPLTDALCAQEDSRLDPPSRPEVATGQTHLKTATVARRAKKKPAVAGGLII